MKTHPKSIFFSRFPLPSPSPRPLVSSLEHSLPLLTHSTHSPLLMRCRFYSEILCLTPFPKWLTKSNVTLAPSPQPRPMHTGPVRRAWPSDALSSQPGFRVHRPFFLPHQLFPALLDSGYLPLPPGSLPCPRVHHSNEGSESATYSLHSPGPAPSLAPRQMLTARAGRGSVTEISHLCYPGA